MDKSLMIKIEKIRMKELLKVIDGRIEELNEQIKTISEIALRKSVQKTKLFSAFILIQYGFVHYLIYYHLSWDIMEPITVLLGNMDLFLAYYFFVFKDRPYTLHQIQQNIE